RILGDRQPPHGHRAGDDKDDRNNSGEDRPVDEEVGEAHGRFLAQSAPICTAAADAEAARDCCGVTFAPGRARMRPLTMTLSSGVRPCVMTRKPSTTGPSVTYLDRATFSASTTSTNLRAFFSPLSPSAPTTHSFVTSAS